MLKLRQNVFETNSSSCHSLTVVDKVLKQKLYKGEAFYYGEIDFDVNGGLFKNVIDEKYVISRDDLIKKLNDFLENDNFEKSDYNKFTKITEENLNEAISNFFLRSDFSRYCGILVKYPRFFLGNEDNSDLVDRFDLEDNKELRLVEICC